MKIVIANKALFVPLLFALLFIEPVVVRKPVSAQNAITENPDAAIKVTDMFGKNVYEISGSSTLQYRFGNTLPSALYIVQVTQGSSVKAIKVIKQ